MLQCYVEGIFPTHKNRLYRVYLESLYSLTFSSIIIEVDNHYHDDDLHSPSICFSNTQVTLLHQLQDSVTSITCQFLEINTFQFKCSCYLPHLCIASSFLVSEDAHLNKLTMTGQSSTWFALFIHSGRTVRNLSWTRRRSISLSRSMKT